MIQFTLSLAEKKTLLKIARNSLNSLFNKKEEWKINAIEYTENLKTPCGVFISLYFQKSLKGCIGSFESNKPLIELIENITKLAAKNDYRFSPVKQADLDDIHIEISVLTPLERINNVEEIELGKHGIYIKKNENRGTFLPQVAPKTNWSKEEFFSHCSRDKARIGWNGWKSAELFRYEAIIINELKILN